MTATEPCSWCGNKPPKPMSADMVEGVEVAIADELHLIPNGTTWEDESVRLSKAALTYLQQNGYLKG